MPIDLFSALREVCGSDEPSDEAIQELVRLGYIVAIDEQAVCVDKHGATGKEQKSIQLKTTAGNTGKIAYLREKALNAFLEKLKKQENENLWRVVLFGSVARGDSRADSDIDVFVLLKSGSKELENQIIDIATDVQLEEGECEVHISPFIYTLEEYQDRRSIGLPVFYNIDKEGIVLYDIKG